MRASACTNAVARAASRHRVAASRHRHPGTSSSTSSIVRGFAARGTAPAPAPAPAPSPSRARGVQTSATAAAPAVADAPKPVYLKDYAPPDYRFDAVSLDFYLGEDVTIVTNTMRTSPTFDGAGDARALFLHGDPSVVLKSVAVDGVALEPGEGGYVLTAKGLTIASPPTTPFELAIVTEIKPQDNTELEGLYKSSGNFCTQCEAEGFRRITFYQDRPDVMSVFTTKIVAEKSKYPVLLSNGNLVESGDLDGGKHFTVWEDPFPKPAYLFALVAGDLGVVEDSFTTSGGRDVALKIYVEAHNLDKADFAMASLIKSMKWDEDVFGLEYDLDLFNIVAVDDFNMGAMENKSLNIFNSRLILATPTTATDADYAAIEGVVAHEYFHNWTGNRVTCRDWFQLSLKEGLTVYRDQEFSADMNSRGVKRIGDVSRLRAAQFPQDSGPMAHSIRPESYIKMDNFYTVTVYEKGAEVVRMYETLLGKDGFRKGMDLYFKRHDGQAVTTDDFLAAMADANDVNLDAFLPWYTQAGTPALDVKTKYDATKKTFEMKCTQSIPDTPGQTNKTPTLMPIAVGLVGPDGVDMPLTLEGEDVRDADAAPETTKSLRLEEASKTFTFTNVAEKPTPSILRNFSAPVKLTTDLTQEDLIFLMSNDSDAFNRWEAGQTLTRALLLGLVDDAASGRELQMDAAIVDAMRKIASGAFEADADKAFIARAMTLPSEGELSELVSPADPDVIHAARDFVVKSLARELRPELERIMAENTAEAYSNEPGPRAARTLKNAALGLLSRLEDPAIDAEALRRFHAADNMTDQIAALASLASRDCPERAEALDAFYERWKHDPLIMNKWLGIQAGAALPGNVKNVVALTKHPAFDIKNPNKVYSLVGGFVGGTPTNFHAKDGSGYEFLGDIVIELDAVNGSVAARMVGGFTRWKKYDEERRALMKAQLERILNVEGLSENVFEIVSKSLE
jgi:aminopeptidase N